MTNITDTAAMTTKKYWIGIDKPVVEHHIYKEAHWSELPKPSRTKDPRNWYESDNDPESPLEADWDKHKEPS